MHALGDQKLYFGDEQVTVGQPVVDSTDNFILNDDGSVKLYNCTDFNCNNTTTLIYDSHNRPLLHKRGGAVFVQDAQHNWVADTYAAGTPVLRLGNEPKLYLGGEAFLANAVATVDADTSFFHIAIQGNNAGHGMPGDVLYTNLEAVNITTGDGNDLFTIVNTHTGTTSLSTTGGADQIAVRSISGATTINAGDGNDVVDVGSTAGVWYTTTPAHVPGTDPAFIAVNGIVDNIGALLTIHGNAGQNTLNVDDSGDTNNNDGQLTSTDITGLDMAGSIHYDGFADDLNIVLGHGNDIFIVVSTHTGTTRIEGRSGNDEIDIRSIWARPS